MSPDPTSPRANLVGYARSAAAYERGRPDYPPAAIAFLAARLRLGPGRVVVDLAAGTGKLTRPLLATGAEVVAVEPVAEMRAELPAGARAMNGTAEEMPLSTGSADAGWPRSTAYCAPVARSRWCGTGGGWTTR